MALYFFIIYGIAITIAIAILTWKRKKQHNSYKQQIQQQKQTLYNLNKQCKDAENELVAIIKEQKSLTSYRDKDIARYKQEIEQQQQKTKKVIQSLKQQQKNFEKISRQAADTWITNLQQQYQKRQDQFDNSVNDLNTRKVQYEKKLDQIKASLSAAAAAQVRQREKEEKLDFYKLHLSEQDEHDIAALEDFKIHLFKPDILCKLIWSNYFQKQTTELCNRILGTEKVCGIYKITDTITKQVYIGQSVNIAERLKQHIKCGLGIDASPTNVLYKAMQHDKVWNFTFELVEACDKTKLNEREKFWINTYNSNKVGLNSTAGGS